MRRWILGVGVLLAAAWAQAADPVALARDAVNRWIAGELTPAVSVQDLQGKTPEEIADLLRRTVAFPPPPPELEVNLEEAQVDALPAGGERVRFPAVSGSIGGEVVVVVADGRVERIAWRPSGGLLPGWVKSSVTRWIFAAVSLLLLLNAVQGGVSRWLRGAWAQLRGYRRLYWVVNLLLYGLFVFGALLAYAMPDLARALQEAVGGAIETIGLEEGVKGGVSGLAWMIFYWNFTHGLLLTSFFPALLLGLPALLVNAARYYVFGFALSPAVIPWSVYVWHIPTLLIELQGYILVTFGGLVLFWETFRGGGFRAGLRYLGLTLLLGTFFLLAGAWYEAFELLYLLR
ncbi:stage II sporulation protein M [Oceanithermus sp.]|uniref:stage II sporulation protein M n=1 Tax=Oceanithermus sp. TaxID=2268145 RepID=UPI00257D032F|nr:stage II sporulation protein M [Oceanithermus sp.]